MADRPQYLSEREIDLVCGWEKRADQMGVKVVHVTKTDKGHVWRIELGKYVECADLGNGPCDMTIAGWRTWLAFELENMANELRKGAAR